MTPEQIRNVALMLYALIVESYDVAAPKAVRAHCLRACQARGLDLAEAWMISEALTGYIYNWNSRPVPLVTPIAKAQTVLHLSMGGRDDTVIHTCPAGERLTPSAIAAMIEWVLTVGVET
jgi:hypothetical protein